ncbi:aminoglycoside nucleotidyltransferase [Candidatus Roizmanbacteria bacterium]|nr:aminoglycoside nucleotidyltransferase [Candidatus Roizmanbacteria bacterium]
MEDKEVVALYRQLKEKGIEIWIDGGWGVDALLGIQTREHEDVDIVIQQKDVPELRILLTEKGYKDVPRDDTSTWNFVLGDSDGHLIDVHAIILDAKGNGLYGPAKKGVMYPARSLIGIGKIVDQTVRCIAAEYLVEFHSGYKLKEKDFKDVTALCDKFKLDLPEQYRGKSYST